MCRLQEYVAGIVQQVSIRLRRYNIELIRQIIVLQHVVLCEDSRLLVSHFGHRNVSVTRWRATKSVHAVREKLIDRRNMISPRGKKDGGASEF
jgi:hypothetical protein